MTELEKVKVLIGIDTDDTDEDSLLELLIEQAGNIISKLTRTPKDYDYLKVEAVVVAYNQRGEEGKRSQNSGGFSTSSYHSAMSGFIRANMPANYII
jgi:hypothetical protein